MKIKKIIEQCANFLKDDEISSLLILQSDYDYSTDTTVTVGDTSGLSDEQIIALYENAYLESFRDLKTFLECVNLVYCEIASDYFYLKKLTEISVSGDFGYSLSSGIEGQEFYKILKIIDSNHCRRYIEIYDNILHLPNGEYKVLFAHKPADFDLGDELNLFDGLVPIRIFCYGVLREYCLINSLYEQAKMWDNRFVDYMSRKSLKGKNGYILSRRW